MPPNPPKRAHLSARESSAAAESFTAPLTISLQNFSGAVVRVFITLLLLCAWLVPGARADSLSDNPILFVTAVPNPADFGTFAATFANHVPNPNTAYRGGDLWIRYPDGTLKNLTAAAGFGSSGLQGANAIAVRDPAVHWDGTKAIFSMLVGAPTQQYQLTSHRWQIYEITGLGSGDTPSITKLANQPAAYNNIMPVYGSDDSIIFVSDRPRDDTVLHIYPQRDEYESTATNTGIWKLSAGSGALVLLDHAPSGDFDPIVDSFGRIVFTRWDHLQRDQQNVGVSFGAFNYASEQSTASVGSAPEVFPEPRDVDDPDYRSNVNLFTINQFFPWMMNQDGTDLETLNHVGRQEIGNYIERSFNDDSNVQEFYKQYDTGANENDFELLLHLQESPITPGTYYGTNCPEFGTHAAGQIMSITGAPGVNPNDMVVTNVTHPDTASSTASPSSNHSGLYRDPLPLSNGKLLAAHTSETRPDANIGSSTAPLSRYAFRIKLLAQSGAHFSAGTPLTAGISKSVSFWDPDKLVSYSGELWELSPVEVRPRARPAAGTLELPDIEEQVITASGATLDELREYLRANNLALVVSRNVTTRDENDRQQPINLRVPDGAASLPRSGKIYDVSHLQFFQGDLVRGYSSLGTGGRRVLAQHMHSVGDGINPPLTNAPAGSVRVASDGSAAAFVPARRALSWQLVSPSGDPVVRERYWVTFQPGEIRVCASCHGVNEQDHLGNGAPQNAPLALAELIAHWKDLPIPTPTPGGPENGSYSLRVRGLPKVGPRKRFQLSVRGASAGEQLTVRSSVNDDACPAAAPLTLANDSARKLAGRFPAGRYRVRFTLHAADGGSELASARANIRGRRSGRARKRSTAAALCPKLRLRVR